MNEVYLIPCPDYGAENADAAMRNLVEQAHLLENIKPGSKIVIKANLVTFLKPEAAATTHPALLCALTRILIAHGASVIIGDSPGGLYNAVFVKKVYNICGLKEAQNAGAELNADFSTKTARFVAGKVLKDFEYTAYLDNCDAIINFCKLKTHGMMGLSAAVKNMFGAIPGIFKPEYHMRFPNHAAFADMLIDLNLYFKPVFNIVDGVIGMEGNGPTMGTPRHVGAIIAGYNPYNVDLVCAKIIGIADGMVPTITAAIKRGLSCKSVNDVEICGNIEDFCVRDFKLMVENADIRFRGEHNIISKFGGAMARLFIKNKPKTCKAECTGCGKCANICPARAIKIKNGIAAINRKKCIKCFCCQEFCPKGAMKVHRPAITKIINRKH